MIQKAETNQIYETKPFKTSEMKSKESFIILQSRIQLVNSNYFRSKDKVLTFLSLQELKEYQAMSQRVSCKAADVRKTVEALTFHEKGGETGEGYGFHYGSQDSIHKTVFETVFN
jgi:hypothetical protein